MVVTEAKKAILILGLYGWAVVFGFLASIPMLMHVYPDSECLLFSHPYGDDRLSYGSHVTCNIVAYGFLFVILYCSISVFGAICLTFRCLKVEMSEMRRLLGYILFFHSVVTLLALALTILTTAGYIVTCENLHKSVSGNIANKLNANPYKTIGEQIFSRSEDDYKFHRYLNRYGNAFGSESYTIRITCRSILTDPEIHQKLHDTHIERQSRYHAYWLYAYAYDAQYEATKTNALIEASMGGSWLCFGFLLAAMIFMIWCALQKEENLAEWISMHSRPLGTGGAMAPPEFGPDPIWTTCPKCNEEILTMTQKSISTFQMLVAGGLCCLGCIWCFYIPFCKDDWKNVLHTCPNCNYTIGRKGERTFIMRRSQEGII